MKYVIDEGIILKTDLTLNEIYCKMRDRMITHDKDTKMVINWNNIKLIKEIKE